MIYDPDHVGCCIEPKFEEVVVGWATEEIIRIISPIARQYNEGDLPDWNPDEYVRQQLPEPKPIVKKVLTWREVH